MRSGVYTALVTPFNTDGTIDYRAYSHIIEAQVRAKVSGIVPLGTTGESPTITSSERHELIETAVKAADGRVSVVAGSGTNDTREAIEMTKEVA